MADLTYVELFAGAGGLSLGLEAAGFRPWAHCEIEPHARAVLRYRWPDVRLDGDVTQVNGADFRGVTLISGGSPCQDLSVAGKRAGLAGARSGLFHQQVRIWQESHAPYLLWENVLGALSSNGGADFAAVLSALVGTALPVPADGWRSGGVAAGPDAVAAWRVLDLQHFGPPQRRVRVFVLTARAGGVDPAEVLALSESLCRHPSPRQQQREGAAPRTGAGAQGSSGVGAFQNTGQGWWNQSNVAQTLRCGGDATLANVVAFESTGGSWGVNEGDTVPPIKIGTGGEVTHALTHEGADASEDGTGRVTPIVLASGQANAEVGNGISPSLTLLHEAPIVVGSLDVHHSTKWGSHQWVAQQKAMISLGRPRRLTPLECERLMSWPDQWTATGITEDGTQYALSDTARYRLCGNGVGSVCVAWFATRLAAML